MEQEIKQLVEKYPNNFELGEAIRSLYWKQNANEKPANTTTENTMWTQTTTWE